MIIRLFCPQCASAAVKNLSHAQVDVVMPVSRLEDNGCYKVECSAGHVSTVVLNNAKFELLFETGINALIDGYPREAVSSFASSLERFYEFTWRVIANVMQTPTAVVEDIWKVAAKQSERQLGLFLTAYMYAFKKPPTTLSNSEVKFRNDVIHAGYIPSDSEATSFGDTVMRNINCIIDELRSNHPDALKDVYGSTTPHSKDVRAEESEIVGEINVISSVDVRYPLAEEQRCGGVKGQFSRILREREPHKLTLMTKEELESRYPGVVSKITSE